MAVRLLRFTLKASSRGNHRRGDAVTLLESDPRAKAMISDPAWAHVVTHGHGGAPRSETTGPAVKLFEDFHRAIVDFGERRKRLVTADQVAFSKLLAGARDTLGVAFEAAFGPPPPEPEPDPIEEAEEAARPPTALEKLQAAIGAVGTPDEPSMVGFLDLAADAGLDLTKIRRKPKADLIADIACLLAPPPAEPPAPVDPAPPIPEAPANLPAPSAPVEPDPSAPPSADELSGA